MREEPEECGHLLDLQNQCPRVEKKMHEPPANVRAESTVTFLTSPAGHQVSKPAFTDVGNL